MTEQRNERVAVIVGGILVAVGAFLPWVTLGIIEISGLRGDGVFAILLGVGIAGLGVATFSSGPGGQWGTLAVMAVLSIVLYGMEFVNVTSASSATILGRSEPGAGLLLGGVGGVVALVASVGLRNDGTATATPEPPEPAIEYAPGERGSMKPWIAIAVFVVVLVGALAYIGRNTYQSGTPAGGAARIAKSIQGNASMKTETVDLQGDYVVAWAATSSVEYGCYHAAFLQRTDGPPIFQSVVSQMVNGLARQEGTNRVYGLAAGRYYLDVTTTCGAWTFTFTPA